MHYTLLGFFRRGTYAYRISFFDLFGPYSICSISGKWLNRCRVGENNNVASFEEKGTEERGREERRREKREEVRREEKRRGTLGN